MKPVWDTLMRKWSDKPDVLIADVDCTGAGKKVCEMNAVESYPVMKWGEPSALKEYNGGRQLQELQDFAEENLKAMCSPKNIHLCDSDKRKKIQKLMSMDAKELTDLIQKKMEAMKEADKVFEEEVEKLRKEYKEIEDKKEQQIAEIKASGLSLMKAVAEMPDPKAEL
eukprot:gnl/TRDRNA2_/TRDRNA2_90844_c0_seq1.p1 gnl/TRDRNA2_/TRDRNA2_90844_c0~~gnl/TRDRNA2_/TRDRNA2_90844_c0_seq1.p1  ORF type:complete len:168 (+),score=59.08 gnl/TRDRNA2_/TRDRNA2_90844_c0_seq1:217-720(+)